MADLLQGVQEGAAAGSGDFKLPSTEELLEALEKMTDLSEEQKKELLDGILRQQQDGGFPGLNALPAAPPPAANNFSVEIVWMLSLLSIVFLVLVFFGYKLYKSLVDREKRREEKKRQKLQKKKK